MSPAVVEASHVRRSASTVGVKDDRYLGDLLTVKCKPWPPSRSRTPYPGVQSQDDRYESLAKRRRPHWTSWIGL